MKKNIAYIIIAFLCSATYLFGQNYYELTTPQAYELWMAEKSNPNFVVIDIRTPDEYKAGHLENALNVDYYKTDEFYAYFSKLDKTKKYLIYCASSGRSGQAIAQFKARNFNFNDMSDMKGGLNSWNSRGYPTTTTPPAATENVSDTKYTLTMYPNPCKGDINIVTLNNQELAIYNAIGNVLFEKTCSQGIQHINLNHLPKGLYIVKIKANNRTHIDKLVIE